MDLESLKDIFVSISVFLPRMALIFWTVPFFGRRMLPGYIRISIMMCFVPVLYPIITTQGKLFGGGSIVIYFLIIMKEALIGFLIGFLISIVFWVAESAGMIIDNQRGALSALLSDPMPESQTTPWGNLLFHVVVVLFFIQGGFLGLVGGVFESYQVWPVYSFFPKIDIHLSHFVLKQTDLIMKLSVICAAPVVIACFAAELGLGMVNRFAPQLNVFFLSMPIKSGIGLVVMILYFGFLMSYLGEQFLPSDKIPAFLKAVIG